MTNYYLLLNVESNTEYDYICVHEQEVFDAMAGSDLSTTRTVQDTTAQFNIRCRL